MINWPDPTTFRGRSRSYTIMAMLSTLVSVIISLAVIALVAVLVATVLSTNGAITFDRDSLIILIAIAAAFKMLIGKRVHKVMFAKKTEEIHNTPCRDCK